MWGAMNPPRVKKPGCWIAAILLPAFLWYWLSGEIFRPRGKNAVELTVVYADGQPVANALLRLTQSGPRAVIFPVPFGPHRTVTSHFERTTDAKGFCRFTFNDQVCQLKEVLVADVPHPVIRTTEFRGPATYTREGLPPAWLLSVPSTVYVYQVAVAAPK